MLEKLRPCPFCGKCQKMERAPKIPAYWVSYRCRDKGTFQTEAEAVKFWNQRAADAQSKDLRERMANAVEDLQAIQNDGPTLQRIWGLAMSAEYHLTLKLDPPLGQGPEKIE